MKTLKEELQEIVDNDLLNNQSIFICVNLSRKNELDFALHKDMARGYGKNFFSGGGAWWHVYDLSDTEFKFVISEKYRFIKDLIAIL